MTHRDADRLQLSIGEIHVWTGSAVNDRRVTAAMLPLLSQKERARAAQFSFERDRVRFIQTHGRVRQILSNYCGAGAAGLAFAQNRHGKPYLVSPVNGPDLQFSVSHSSDCCMLAVGRDHPIGIDVEKLRDVPRATDIARRYFTSKESRALAALHGRRRRDAFFALWTHKEATVKGLGISLAANLGGIEFDIDPLGGLRLVAWDGNRSLARRWSVLSLDPGPRYIAAVASAHPIRSLALRNWSHIAPD
jgi:4'-phosphopantetheinyl transferase